MTSFYNEEELLSMGFKSVGKGCKISRNAKFYGISNISMGDNVRIDDFCIVSGNVTFGSHIHVSPYVALYGALGIIFEDYTGISAHSVVYSAMDDFGGDYLVGSVHPEELTNVTGGLVRIQRFSQIGVNCVVFPNLVIEEGVVVGACSLITKSLTPWGIYVGIPAKRLKDRKNYMIQLVNKPMGGGKITSLSVMRYSLAS